MHFTDMLTGVMTGAMKTSLKILTIISFLAAASTAFAAQELRQLIYSAHKSCPSLVCTNLNFQMETLSEQEVLNLHPRLMGDIEQVIHQIAEEIWPDTILEDHYVSENKTLVQSIAKVLKDGMIVGYRVTFYRNAIHVDSNTHGKIVESIFLTPDLYEIFHDPSGYAHFVNKIYH